MNKGFQKKSKFIENKLEEIKKDFIKIIPQLKDIQKTQRVYPEIQREKVEEQYPFINTQTSSTI